MRILYHRSLLPGQAPLLRMRAIICIASSGNHNQVIAISRDREEIVQPC